jgi:hypothetical protein
MRRFMFGGAKKLMIEHIVVQNRNSRFTLPTTTILARNEF